MVISTAEPTRVIAIAERHRVRAREIGRVTKEPRLRIVAGDRAIDAPLARLASIYYDSIASIMQRGPAETAVAEQHPSIATV
jgi:phosphoribosylformylglycinamidine (FGAM) synthase-like enzyme